jgi:hypothetical protein
MHVWNAEKIMSINLNSEAAHPKKQIPELVERKVCIYIQQTLLLIGKQLFPAKLVHSPNPWNNGLFAS